MNTRVKFGSALSRQVGQFSVGVNTQDVASSIPDFQLKRVRSGIDGRKQRSAWSPAVAWPDRCPSQTLRRLRLPAGEARSAPGLVQVAGIDWHSTKATVAIAGTIHTPYSTNGSALCRSSTPRAPTSATGQRQCTAGRLALVLGGNDKTRQWDRPHPKAARSALVAAYARAGLTQIKAGYPDCRDCA